MSDLLNNQMESTRDEQGITTGSRFAARPGYLQSPPQGNGSGAGVPQTFPPVLDACCGGRMMWFDKHDRRSLFVDKRVETYVQVRTDCGNKVREVKPDIQADFTNLPFPDATFALVVFDPPHKIVADHHVLNGGIVKAYGVLFADWREVLSAAFAECFRVLRCDGVLVFKWCEIDISLSDVLALTPNKPLFGHRVGRRERTHWVCFIKGAAAPADSGDNPAICDVEKAKE